MSRASIATPVSINGCTTTRAVSGATFPKNRRRLKRSKRLKIEALETVQEFRGLLLLVFFWSSDSRLLLLGQIDLLAQQDRKIDSRVIAALAKRDLPRAIQNNGGGNRADREETIQILGIEDRKIELSLLEKWGDSIAVLIGRDREEDHI